MTPASLRLIEGGKRPPGFGVALEFAALGLALTAIMAWIGRLPGWSHDLGRFQGLYAAAFGLYFLAVARMKRWASLPRVGWAVLAVAIATRAALFASAPSLSGDIHRYIWEGNVLAHGLDPYRLSPADPELSALRDPAVYPFVNHPELSAIYPPLAIAGYAVVARLSPSVPAIKLWVVLHDLLIVVVLLAWMRRRGASEAQVLVYAWNPLVLVEFAGSGHNDPTGMLWLVLAFLWAERRPVPSALALTAGTLTKLVPLLALPFLWTRWTARAPRRGARDGVGARRLLGTDARQSLGARRLLGHLAQQ